MTEADGARLETGAGLPAGPSHIVTLAKHTIVYGLSGVLLQAVGIVTLPIFARAFTQAEYGKLELGLVLSSVALTVVDLGFASAAQRSFYDYSDSDAEQRRRVLFTAIVATSTAAVVARAGARGATRRARQLDLRRLERRAADPGDRGLDPARQRRHLLPRDDAAPLPPVELRRGRGDGGDPLRGRLDRARGRLRRRHRGGLRRRDLRQRARRRLRDLRQPPRHRPPLLAARSCA